MSIEAVITCWDAASKAANAARLAARWADPDRAAEAAGLARAAANEAQARYRALLGQPWNPAFQTASNAEQRARSEADIAECDARNAQTEAAAQAEAALYFAEIISGMANGMPLRPGSPGYDRFKELAGDPVAALATMRERAAFVLDGARELFRKARAGG